MTLQHHHDKMKQNTNYPHPTHLKSSPIGIPTLSNPDGLEEPRVSQLAKGEITVKLTADLLCWERERKVKVKSDVLYKIQKLKCSIVRILTHNNDALVQTSSNNNQNYHNTHQTIQTLA